MVSLIAWGSCILLFSIMLFSSHASHANHDPSLKKEYDKKHLHVGIGGEPDSLDPTTNFSDSIQRITYQNIYEGLTQVDINGQVIPSLAESWTVSDDGLTYLFNIRKGVKFHNGLSLTPEVVKHSLERMKSSSGNNLIREKFSHIHNIDIVAPFVVRLQLSWEDPQLLLNLAVAQAVIQEPSSIKANNISPVGTGPYRFVHWVKGEHITLESVSHYWSSTPAIQHIKISFVTTSAERFNLLMENEIDAFVNMTEMSFVDALLQIRSNYKQVIGETGGETIIGFNHQNPMLANLSIRQGINHAIDRNKIKSTPHFITGDNISSFFPPNQPGSLDLSDRYDVNLSVAKSLIESSGIEIEPLRLIIPPALYARFIGLHAQQMLEKIDIPVTIEMVSWNEWERRVIIGQDYDLTVMKHTNIDDLDFLANPDNYFRYHNEEYNQIISSISKTVSQDERIKLQYQAQRMLVDDAVGVFLFMHAKVGVWDRRLSGYWVDEPLPSLIFSQIHWE